MSENMLIKQLPKLIVYIGSTSYLCKGNSAESRRIEVEDIPFYSIGTLVSTFPELMHHPSVLAQCANFLLSGETFRVITDLNVFKRNYLHTQESTLETKYGRIDLNQIHSPRFVANSFIFFVWNEINDLPYRVQCSYPFSNNRNDILYSILL